MARRRSNGEGSFFKKTINGIEYQCYRKQYENMDKPKNFYATTLKELKQKIKDYENSNQMYISNDFTKKTFYEYVCWWLETQKKNTIREGTYLDYQDLMKYYVKDFNDFDIGSKQMGQINYELFQKHIDALAKYYSRSTILRIYAVITPSLKYAKKKSYILEEVWEDYHMPSEDNVAHKKKKPKFLPKEDLYKLFNEANRINQRGDSFGTIGSPTYGNNAYALMLILGGAFRKGEALSLKWKNISFEKRTISIESSVRLVRNTVDDNSKYILHESLPKTDESIRIIPMSDIALWALTKFNETYPNHKPDDNICLNKNGNIIQERNLRRTLAAMLNRADCSIKDANIHSLRHSMTSLVVYETGQVEIMSSVLGHTKASSLTVDTYTHHTDEQAFKTLNILDINKE